MILDTSVSSQTSSTFSKQSQNGLYTNKRGTFQLTPEQKERLDSLHGDQASFQNPVAFSECHLSNTPQLFKQSQQFWSSLVRKLYLNVFRTIVLPRGMVVECLKPAVAPAVYSEVLNHFCGQLILSKELEVVRDYAASGILKTSQKAEQDSWSAWLYGKVSGSCKRVLNRDTKQSSFQVQSDTQQLLLNVPVLETVCQNIVNRDRCSPLMLKSEFKHLLRQNFSTELEVQIFKSYLKKTTETKSQWLHYYSDLVKISPFAIDKLDIALHHLTASLAAFQSASQQLVEMDLYDWKQTVRHNLLRIMQEFESQVAKPTLASIQKLIGSDGRLNAFQLTRELLDQTNSDFATISQVFAVLQMEYPQARDIEQLRGLNLL